MATKKTTLKVHRTSEDRSGVVDRLIDAGFEVLQTKTGVQIGFGDGTVNFKLTANSIGAQGLGEIAAQARSAETMFNVLAKILETPSSDCSRDDCSRDDSSSMDLS